MRTDSADIGPEATPVGASVSSDRSAQRDFGFGVSTRFVRGQLHPSGAGSGSLRGDGPVPGTLLARGGEWGHPSGGESANAPFTLRPRWSFHSIQPYVVPSC